MSKIIPCPISHFAGQIIVPDFVNYEVLTEWQHSAVRSLKLFDRLPPGEDGKPGYVYKPDTVDADFRVLRIPVILLYVEKWELKNFPANPTVKTFPATPKRAAEKLYNWLRDLMSAEIDAEEIDDPNA